jgi:hypothetical protein
MAEELSVKANHAAMFVPQDTDRPIVAASALIMDRLRLRHE